MQSSLIIYLLISLLTLDAPKKSELDVAYERTAAALEKYPSAKNFERALDAAYRVDQWQRAAAFAQQAYERMPRNANLYGRIARALWRAGEIEKAEEVAEKIPPDTTDPVAVSMQVLIAMSHGKHEHAIRRADRLAGLKGLTGADYGLLVNASFFASRFDGLAMMIREALEKVDPKHGYPEMYLQENLEGMAEFLDEVGTAPMNQVRTFGQARMPVSTLNLPMCEVMINGKGPYRMVVDTGGSVLLSIDTEVAKETGLKLYAPASVRGVSGVAETHQAIVDDLAIGEIRVHRAMTRVFDIGKSLMYSADGILGTGMFSDARMTMDFENGQLVVQQPASGGAPGHEVPIRIVADAKILGLIDVNGRRAVGLFDSGADAVAVAPTFLKKAFPNSEIMEVDVGAIGVGNGELPKIALGPGIELKLPGKTYPSISGIGLDILDTTLGPIIGVQADVLIGMPVFRELRTCTVDFPSSRMWVEWLGDGE
ncbi:MAG: aspartyl protease family protein [Phycisphaerae bacterium]